MDKFDEWVTRYECPGCLPGARYVLYQIAAAVLFVVGAKLGDHEAIHPYYYQMYLFQCYWSRNVNTLLASSIMTKNAELTNLPRRQGLGGTLAEKTGTKPDFERKALFSWCEKHFALEGLEKDGAGELLSGKSEEVKTSVMALIKPLLPPPAKIGDVVCQPPLLPSSPVNRT